LPRGEGESGWRSERVGNRAREERRERQTDRERIRWRENERGRGKQRESFKAIRGLNNKTLYIAISELQNIHISK
jgi:hypothetical protein